LPGAPIASIFPAILLSPKQLIYAITLLQEKIQREPRSLPEILNAG
jgi:hypothetical protein